MWRVYLPQNNTQIAGNCPKMLLLISAFEWYHFYWIWSILIFYDFMVRERLESTTLLTFSSLFLVICTDISHFPFFEKALGQNISFFTSIPGGIRSFRAMVVKKRVFSIIVAHQGESFGVTFSENFFWLSANVKKIWA